MLQLEDITSHEAFPGTLVRLPKMANSKAADDMYCLVAPYRALPSSALSSLRQIKLKAPNGTLWNGVPSEWVRYVWGDARRGITLVQLTKSAVNRMSAAGVTCREVATAAERMRITHFTCDSHGLLKEESARIARVDGDTLSSQFTRDGLLVAEDGSLLAATTKSDSTSQTHYSMMKIGTEFQEQRMRQIRFVFHYDFDT